MPNDARLWGMVQMGATEAADRLQSIEEDVKCYHAYEVDLRDLEKLQRHLADAEACVQHMRISVSRLQNIRTIEAMTEEVA